MKLDIWLVQKFYVSFIKDKKYICRNEYLIISTKKNIIKKYAIVITLIVFTLNACMEKKCCCVLYNGSLNIQLKDSSQNGAIDTNFIKSNNALDYFHFTDSVSYLKMFANVDSTENNKSIITSNYLKVSAADTDTIFTEISGICGRTISKIWYNGF